MSKKKVSNGDNATPNLNIESSLAQICGQLNTDYGTDITFTISAEEGKIIINEHYEDDQGEPQTRMTGYRYGYGAQVQLATLYSEHYNLRQLLEIFNGLSEFGYDIVDHDQLFVGVAASICVTLCTTNEEFRVFLTDNECERYTGILERCRAARTLAKHASAAKKEFGVEIHNYPDGFKMVSTKTGEVLMIPDYDGGFTPSCGQYPYDTQTVNAALKTIGIPLV